MDFLHTIIHFLQVINSRWHPGSTFNTVNAPHNHPANTGAANAPHNHPGSAGGANAPHGHTTNTNNTGSHHHEMTGVDDVEPDNTSSRDKWVNSPYQNSNTFPGGAHNHPTVNCNTVNAPHSHAANTSSNSIPHGHNANVGNTNAPHTHPANLNTVNAPHSHGLVLTLAGSVITSDPKHRSSSHR